MSLFKSKEIKIQISKKNYRFWVSKSKDLLKIKEGSQKEKIIFENDQKERTFLKEHDPIEIKLFFFFAVRF